MVSILMDNNVEGPVKLNPSEIDWLRYQDVELARQYGRTRERIRQIRREGNYPDARNKGKNTTRVTLVSKLSSLDTTNFTFQELHEKFGGSKDHLKACLKELGKGYKRA